MSRPDEPSQTDSPIENFMLKKPETNVLLADEPIVKETVEQRFERILLRPQFKQLKAVFDNLGITVTLMQAAIVTTNCYQNFLSKLAYRLVVVKHIHENDCYTRLGPAGGIRAVLPIHDTNTYSTMVTLVNYDVTVTTTANAVDHYDHLLADFKTLLMNRSGDAA